LEGELSHVFVGWQNKLDPFAAVTSVFAITQSVFSGGV